MYEMYEMYELIFCIKIKTLLGLLCYLFLFGE